MAKKEKTTNRLTKKKTLIGILKNHKVERTNSQALYLIDDFLKEEADKLSANIKEIITIKAKKTANSEDVQEAISGMEKKGAAFEI